MDFMDCPWIHVVGLEDSHLAVYSIRRYFDASVLVIGCGRS